MVNSHHIFYTQKKKQKKMEELLILRIKVGGIINPSF